MDVPPTVEATRYVAPLREGGSLPGLIEADDDGLYVLKFRGAGQGAKSLIAELVAGELGRAAGLPVPVIAFVTLDADRLRALSPDTDPPPLRAQLEGLMRIAAGDPDAGPIARLPFPQRFHQLVAPSSTTLQDSAVRTGMCDDPERMLDHLHTRLVL